MESMFGLASMNSPLNPLTATITGGTVTVAPTAGGANSPVFLLAGRLVEEIDASTAFTPPGATLGRIDLIEAQLVENQVNPFTRLVQPASGPPAPQTVYQLALSCTFQRKQGVDGGSPIVPTPDAGWTAVGTITLPAAGANPTSATITLPMPPTLDSNSGLRPNGVGPAFYAGTGAPTFSAANGSMYLRYDGGSMTRWYANTSGASTSGTTWTAVA